MRVLSDVGLSMNILNDKNHKGKKKNQLFDCKNYHSVARRGKKQHYWVLSCSELHKKLSFYQKKKKLPGGIERG